MKGNLLLVDDEEHLLELLQITLQDLADQIFVATNGAEALRIISDHQIHCVVCDINMPGMNGIQVISQIRSLNNLVPFVFYTGHGNHELMKEAAKFGAFDFLNKPQLKGLDEVVVRGLRQGVSPASVGVSKEDLLSEYQSLLSTITKQKSKNGAL